jgi:aminodeoxyfutalosine synthase
MLSLFARSELKDIIEKVEQGERLEFADGIRLMNSKDILALGYMANIVREQKNENRTYFCVNSGADTGTDEAVHLELILSDVEQLAKTEAGEHWLELQEEAFVKDKRTCIVMRFGTLDTAEEQVNRLLQLRSLQDRLQGFLTFIPVPEYPQRALLDSAMGLQSTTGFADLRMIAVSRILLDNFDHIKAYWAILGPKLAQVSLNFGVDDLGGQVIDRQNHDREAVKHEQAMSLSILLKMIHKAGRQAIEKDDLYRTVNDYGQGGGRLQ